MPWQPDGTRMALALARCSRTVCAQSAGAVTYAVLPPCKIADMSDDDDPFYSPTLKPQPARVARPGETLFEFVRASDRAPMSCELPFHAESYGWEAQFFERDELFYSRGGFVTRALAVQWAEEERTAMEGLQRGSRS
jgi:hypothetical protein